MEHAVWRKQLPKQFGLNEDRFAAYSHEILLDLFVAIHNDMLRQGRFDANCRNMGATLTLAWFLFKAFLLVSAK